MEASPEAAEEWDVHAALKCLDIKDINARSPINGRALLHEACVRGNKDAVKYILENTPVDIEIRTMLGKATPLHLAVHASERSVVFLLLSHGADPSVRDRFGSTPLHYCTKRSIAVHLVQFGARVLATNMKRKTAWQSIQANEDADTELKEYVAEVADVEYKTQRRRQRQQL